MARSNGKNTKSTKGTKGKKNVVENKNDSKNGDIKAIIYISVGILLAVAIYTSWAGALSVFAKKIIYNLIGVGTFILPGFLIYFGIDCIKSRGSIRFSRRIVGSSLVVLMTIFLCGTIELNLMGELDGFGDSLVRIMLSKGEIHGGLLGHLISYPLSKMIGFIGSYLLYIALACIGTILFFDITLYDIITYFKEEVGEISKKKPAKREVREELALKDNNFRTELIENSPKNKQRDEFIQGINNKIKILDFIKNSSLEDDEIKEEVAVSTNRNNQFNIEIYEDEKNRESVPLVEVVPKINTTNNKIEETHKRKEKLTNEVKEVVTKEIEESLTEEKVKKVEKVYIHPSVELLNINSKMKLKSEDKKELIESANKLEGILNDFGVDGRVVQVTKGPSVTRFELQPSPGVKVSKFVNLQDDIALGLAASGVRMEAPIPGKSAIGIEVPNKKQTAVFLREVLDSKEFKDSDNKLAFALGKDIAGKCIVGDIAKMPHTLIAGATGSGKSVCINTLIVSLVYKYSPEEVRLLMIDPKVVELSVYNGIPHLLIPVVTDPKKAAGALNWAVNEMTRRYKLFADLSVRNIESYNSLFDKGIIEEKLPYIVIIVDELADLMMACPNDVEDYICRLAQMARAAGMHLIIATQRPSVDIITGVIKANIPSRISFAVSSGIDSRTILDCVGAEKLLGRGDMLYYPTGASKPLRVQGAFISEEEVEKVVSNIKDRGEEPDYEESIIEHINSGVQSNSQGNNSDDRDELLDEAIKIVVEYNQASTSFIQRRLRVGFNRASRIMDELEEIGIISQKDGSRPRQVLVNKEEIGIED